MTIRFSSTELPAGRFHWAGAGDARAPLILCLHGFPESWLAYEAVLERLSERHFVVAPDQRGFNRSPKPAGVDSYHVRFLAADMFALAEELSPNRPFVLVGHDWGSAVAYAMAIADPERISHLVVVNGVHPWCFQNAIVNDPGQRAASQYMNLLRRPEATEFMAANDFAKTMGMMTGFSSTNWLTDDLAGQYRQQWRQPGALDAMLNWYRASPVIVPEPDVPEFDAPLLDLPAEALFVRIPHLVIWGEDDTALTPACMEGLDRFCADLDVHRFTGAGHWILHERPDVVTDAIKDFLDR
jgi:pimeloyl-ACP methyl ester carboxylesterase